MNNCLSLSKSNSESMGKGAGDVTSALAVSLMFAEPDRPRFPPVCARARRVSASGPGSGARIEMSFSLLSFQWSAELERFQPFHPVMHLETGRPFIRGWEMFFFMFSCKLVNW